MGSKSPLSILKAIMVNADHTLCSNIHGGIIPKCNTALVV